ncbi:MAG: hypothetical protein IJ710_09230 [Prevotella sp.]|nr:hypothetical protein [Prevotella sp.]
MTKLHIFNPEHDLSLASNLANFTPPHAARQLRSDLGFLPAIWADEGDGVLVDDAAYAEKTYKKFVANAKIGRKQIRWVTKQDLHSLHPDRIEPWGWDATLRNFLIRYGVSKQLLPTLEQIDELRWLSHRRCAAQLLQSIRLRDGLTGGVSECRSVEEVEQQIAAWGNVVLKAPWSSSGRGLRFVDGRPNSYVYGWLNNLLQRQGSVMVEPYYNKVKDFGMEFHSDGKGQIDYLGLSLFHTANGAYTGNVLATEQNKEDALSRYIPVTYIETVRKEIQQRLAEAFKGKYVGPFGIDMMIVAQDEKQGFVLHPCVEINLRRTMGHVALALSPADDDIRRVMRIVIESNYKLKTYKL